MFVWIGKMCNTRCKISCIDKCLSRLTLQIYQLLSADNLCAVMTLLNKTAHLWLQFHETLMSTDEAIKDI